MIDIKEQALTEKLKKKIYEGFSHHAIEMTGHNEKFNSVPFIELTLLFKQPSPKNGKPIYIVIDRNKKAMHFNDRMLQWIFL